MGEDLHTTVEPQGTHHPAVLVKGGKERGGTLRSRKGDDVLVAEAWTSEDHMSMVRGVLNECQHGKEEKEAHTSTRIPNARRNPYV